MTDNILVKPKPFAWSYTHIKNFETCPRRYNEIDLLKNFKEEKSQELQDGFAVHDAMAKRINDGTKLPANMPFEHWIQYAMKGMDDDTYLKAEADAAITEDFKPCGFFDRVKPVWMRSKIDVLRIDGGVAHVIDWKTGKIKPEKDQLYLNATCVLAHYPQVFHVKTEFVWLAYNTSSPFEFSVDDVIDFWPKSMSDRVETLRTARVTNNFPPKKSGLCRRWCPVVTCEHFGT